MRKLSILIAIIMLFILIPVSPADAAIIPSVNTLTFTIVKATSGNVGGNIENDNGSPIKERGIVYSLTPNPTVADAKIIVGGTLGKYYLNLSNLSTNSIYYYAAYAINEVGISYGPVNSFRTKKDNTPPAIVGATVSINNTYIDVNMSEYVFGSNKTPLTLGKFKWSFLSNGGSATAATITSVTRIDGTPLKGGESILRFWLSVTGIPSGLETIQIWPTNGTSVYDASNNAMASTQTTGPKKLNDNVSPKIFSGFLSSNNTYMDITMTKGVYGGGKLPLTASQFSIVFTQNDGTATNAVITGVSNKYGQPLIGGETVIRVYISVIGVPSGTEFVTIGPIDGKSIYDSYGNPMSADQSTGPKALNDLLSPTIVSASLSNGNSYIDVNFSQGVYNSAFGALSPIDLQLNFTRNDGNASSVVISNLSKIDGTALIGGESIIRVHLSVSGIPSGQETIEIMPVGPSSIYDYSGNAMFETQSTGIFELFDKSPPLITDSTIALDNSFIDISISKGVYMAGKTPLAAECFIVFFEKNAGTASDVSITGISKINGLPLTGGETSIRLYLSVTGTPNGLETVAFYPEADYLIFDSLGNYMMHTQTTGPKKLYPGTPINQLVHSIKTANGRNAGVMERTFIPGDYVPMYIKLDILSSLTNPVIVANLDSDNGDFCLKELTTNGVVDKSSVFVYKNGVKLDKSIAAIVKESSDNTLRISVNQSFTSGDMVEIVYYTSFNLTGKALRSKSKPSYGRTINFSCHVEWGNPASYYSPNYPGPSGTDQFYASIITADPLYLQ